MSGKGQPVDENTHAARLSWPDRWGRTALDEATNPRVLASSETEEEQIRSGLSGCGELLKSVGALTGDEMFALTSTEPTNQ
jgi:hypothetical protein